LAVFCRDFVASARAENAAQEAAAAKEQGN
jgi:hypothetical protein